MGHCWFAVLVGIEQGDERKECKYKNGAQQAGVCEDICKDTMQHLNLQP